MIGPTHDVYTALVESDERGASLRLPAGLFTPGDRVLVRREGDRVVLEPVPYEKRGWPEGFWEGFHSLPAPTFDRPEQLPTSSTYRDQVIDNWVAETNAEQRMGGEPAA